MQIVPQPIVILPETEQDELRVEMTGVRVILSPKPENAETILRVVDTGIGPPAILTAAAVSETAVAPPPSPAPPAGSNSIPSCAVPPPAAAFDADFERIHLEASSFAERPMLLRTVPAADSPMAGPGEETDWSEPSENTGSSRAIP